MLTNYKPSFRAWDLLHKRWFQPGYRNKEGRIIEEHEVFVNQHGIPFLLEEDEEGEHLRYAEDRFNLHKP